MDMQNDPAFGNITVQFRCTLATPNTPYAPKHGDYQVKFHSGKYLS